MHTQVTEVEDDTSGDTGGDTGRGVDEDTGASDPEDQPEVRSTKRPLSKSQSSCKKTKMNPEDELLQKAINCMETASKPSVQSDKYELFGKYIAAEL